MNTIIGGKRFYTIRFCKCCYGIPIARVIFDTVVSEFVVIACSVFRRLQYNTIILQYNIIFIIRVRRVHKTLKYADHLPSVYIQHDGLLCIQ